MTYREHLRVIVWSVTAWCAIVGTSGTIAGHFLAHAYAHDDERAADPIRSPVPADPITITTLFTGRDDVEAVLVRRIDAARSEILILAYSFTSRPIVNHLIAARARGVVVRAVLDKSNATDPRSGAGEIDRAGCEVVIDYSHAIMHEKAMVFDGSEVECGSYNYSASANRANAENANFIRGGGVPGRYAVEWERHRAEKNSRPFARALP